MSQKSTDLSTTQVIRRRKPKESLPKKEMIKSKFEEECDLLFDTLQACFLDDAITKEAFRDDVRHLITDNIRWDIYNAITTGPMNKLQDRLNKVLDGYFGEPE